MPTFQYEAMTAGGQAVKDRVEAASAEEAVVKIKMQGHYPTRVKEVRVKPATPTHVGGPPKSRRRWCGPPRRGG